MNIWTSLKMVFWMLHTTIKVLVTYFFLSGDLFLFFSSLLYLVMESENFVFLDHVLVAENLTLVVVGILFYFWYVKPIYKLFSSNLSVTKQMSLILMVMYLVFLISFQKFYS